MTAALVRPISAVAWELRGASGRRVALSLAPRAGDRLEGHVDRVAATDAFVVVRGRHVPTADVVAVHLPSRLGGSTARGGEFHRAARRLTRQDEALW